MIMKIGRQAKENSARKVLYIELLGLPINKQPPVLKLFQPDRGFSFYGFATRGGKHKAKAACN
jgi:hypothetical protein